MIGDIFKQNKWMYLGIVYTMFAVPFVVYNQMITLAVLIVWLVFVLWMAAKNKQGVSLVIMALAMTLPEMSKETDVYIIGLRWPQVFLGLSIVAISLIDISYKRRNPVHSATIVCLCFAILYVLYCSRPTVRYFRGLVDAVIFIHCMFYVSFQEKLKFEAIFKGVSLIFIITSIYAISHYFFNIGPYSALVDRSYAESLGYVFVRREGGLFCNSLVMSAICALYHSLILARMLKTKKMAYEMELLCITVAILTISRTAIVILAAQFLFLLFFRRTLRLGTTIAIATVLGIFYFWVLSDTGAIQDLSNRMELTSEHRESGYSTTLEIFSSHPLGVGKQRVSKFMHQYNTGGIEEDLITLDNFYLTQIASYGILCFISFFFYMIYFYKCPRLLRKTDSRNALYLIIFTWCLTGLSFDVESFDPVTVLCFGLLGLLFKNFRIEEGVKYA